MTPSVQLGNTTTVPLPPLHDLCIMAQLWTSDLTGGAVKFNLTLLFHVKTHSILFSEYCFSCSYNLIFFKMRNHFCMKFSWLHIDHLLQRPELNWQWRVELIFVWARDSFIRLFSLQPEVSVCKEAAWHVGLSLIKTPVRMITGGK